jgi:16S rRNA (cytosine1402-N4)-methyltransferase
MKILIIVLLLLAAQSNSSKTSLWRRSLTTMTATDAPVPSDAIGTSSPPLFRRRIRYAGKNPRSYAEKYKEHQLDPTTIAKVIEKGGTPAGSHVSIMVHEILDLVSPTAHSRKPFVSCDCTLGYGGHSNQIVTKLQSLERTRGAFHHVMLDQDPIELQKTQERLAAAVGPDVAAAHLAFHHINFGNITMIDGLRGNVSFLLADLGFSSMQIDDPTRGFTYKVDAPLDMRMDVSRGETARDYLSRVTRKVRVCTQCKGRTTCRDLMDSPSPSPQTRRSS